jgi:hypothetical protein
MLVSHEEIVPLEKTPHINHDTVSDKFHSFRMQLDDHYDRRLRIGKSSRDITDASKKMHAPCKY